MLQFSANEAMKERMMSKAIPEEVQRQIDQMTETFRQQLTALYEWSNGERGGDEPMAVEIERRIGQWIGQIEFDGDMVPLKKGIYPVFHSI